MEEVCVAVVCICTCVLVITGQAITEAPRNTAANFGESVTLNCKADLGGDILEWRRYWNYTYDLIWDSEDDGITDDRFRVDVDSEAGTYNLHILSTEEDLGGPYFVELVNSGVRRDVEVVVLSGLGCVPSTTFETEEGNDILVQCVTGYHGYKAPFMQAHHQDELLSSQDIITENQKSTVASFPATPEHNGTQYWCDLSFKPDENDTMPPLKQDQCDTAKFIVYSSRDCEQPIRIADTVTNEIASYIQTLTINNQDGVVDGVHDVSIQPELTNVNVGDQFVCTAVSYPSPTFKWYCQDRTFLRIGSILTVEEELVGEQLCICNAYTTIFGQNRESETNITFTASSASTTPPGSGPPVAVIVSVVTLVAIICACLCILLLVKTRHLHVRNKQLQKDHEEELRNR